MSTSVDPPSPSPKFLGPWNQDPRPNPKVTTHRSTLRHGEDIDHFDGAVIDELSQQKTHHLEGDSRIAVLEHLDQSQSGDDDLLRVVSGGTFSFALSCLCQVEVEMSEVIEVK